MIISITDGGKYMKNGGSNVCEIENEVSYIYTCNYVPFTVLLISE